MSALRNPKHEKFAKGLAEGLSAVDAYERAGFKRNRSADAEARSHVRRAPDHFEGCILMAVVRLRARAPAIARMRVMPSVGPAKASQPEAEAGALDTKAMTPLRTRQAIAAQVPSLPALGTLADAVNSLAAGKVGTGLKVTGGGLATGGGTLEADRTITVPAASQPEAEAGTDNTKAMTPLRTRQAIAAVSRPDPRAFTTVEPTLDLDFKEGFSHPNYGRTTTKLRRDARGMISGVPANVASIEYNEAGLLLGARFDPHTKNQDTYSNNFDQSIWGKNDVDVSNIGLASPDGFLNAWKLVPKTTSGPKYMQQAFAADSAQRHSFSLFAKAGEITEIGLHADDHPGPDLGVARFDLLAGTASVVNQSDAGSEHPRALIVPYRSGWYRCSITIKADSNAYPNQRSIIYPFKNGSNVFTGNGSDGVFIHRAQHEPTPNPTPTVDTVGSAVTRGADLFSIPIGNWFNPEEGSIYVEARVEMDGRGYPRFVTFTDGTLNNVIDNYLTSYYADVVGVGIVSTGANTGGIESPNRYMLYGSVLKFCYGFTRSTLRSCLNGDAVSEGTMSAFPNITQLDVGHVAGIAQTGGWLRRVLYFPRKLSALEMQRMTAL